MIAEYFRRSVLGVGCCPHPQPQKKGVGAGHPKGEKPAIQNYISKEGHITIHVLILLTRITLY